jgi:hypothetical protein
VVFRRSLEMGLLREEFFRLLPAALGSWEAEGDTVRWSEDGRSGTLRLVPMAGRRLGSVVVPCHRVEIVLDGCSEEDGEAFMRRFHRAFLRGGG